jgi:predicted Abi (CAAX) family protease
VSRATWIAAAGSLVLFISVFLSWYSASGSVGGISYSVSQSGWDTGALAKLVALLSLIAIAALVIELFVPTVTLPFPSSLIVIGAAAISILFILIKLVDKPDGAGLAYGIFVALIAAAVAAYGGYTKMSEA